MNSFDLVAHLTRQMVFSRATFGPGARTEAVLDHLEKEIAEVRASKTDEERIAEWVDLVILSLDGLSRALATQWQHERSICGLDIVRHSFRFDNVAEDACEMIRNKQGVNELRDWPDWRSADPGKAIEHKRGA